ncbi:MAG: hypothetical protein WAV11_03520 [Minisyncoccia bacterium]
MRRKRATKPSFSPEFEKRLEKVLLEVCRKKLKKVCKEYGVISIGGLIGLDLNNPCDLIKIITIIKAGKKVVKTKKQIPRKRGVKCQP